MSDCCTCHMVRTCLDFLKGLMENGNTDATLWFKMTWKWRSFWWAWSCYAYFSCLISFNHYLAANYDFRCTNLVVLSIKSCPNLSDRSLSQIALRCPNLQELDVSYCYGITHESLALIGQKCPNLRNLKRNLNNWVNPFQRAGMVLNECVNSCPQDRDLEAAVIGKYMTHLKRLEIRFSKLSAKGLTSICGGCVELEYLDLSGCANLTSQDILNASEGLRSLEEIMMPNIYIPRIVFRTEGGRRIPRVNGWIYWGTGACGLQACTPFCCVLLFLLLGMQMISMQVIDYVLWLIRVQSTINGPISVAKWAYGCFLELIDVSFFAPLWEYRSSFLSV